MSRARMLLAIAVECLLVLVAAGAVWEVGPLWRARTIVTPSCNVIRVTARRTEAGAPRPPDVRDGSRSPCPERRRGLAAVLVLLPVVFPVRVMYALRGERRRMTTLGPSA